MKIHRYLNRDLFSGCLGIAVVFLLTAHPPSKADCYGIGQKSEPPSTENGDARPRHSQRSETASAESKSSSKQAAQQLGKTLKLAGSETFREAPLTEGGRGGYSSSMNAPEPVPTNSLVEEKAMEGLLLDAGQWRVGPHGLIERSEPNGQWIALPSGVDADLHAVCFINRWVGWVVGQQGTILRSNDSGQNWRRVPFPYRVDLVAVQANNMNSARVTTRTGTVYATSDGGKTWTADRQR